MTLFRQLFDSTSSTYTYLLADGGEAVLIDPVYEQAQRDRALLGELGLRLVATLETHVHADHVTAAWLLRERLASRILLSAASGAEGADRLLTDGEIVPFGSRHLQALATPGHTDGCMSYVMDDRSMVFSGDALLIRGCGRTDFQQGSPKRLYHSVREKLFSLPDSCLVYPGHDYRGFSVSSIAEERQFNPRLGGDADLDDFSGYMDNLNLPHPKRIAEAVPANLNCGRPASGEVPSAAPDWAPLVLSTAGIWQIAPLVLAEHRADAQIVDVREPAEWADELGRIGGARLLPLADLARQLKTPDVGLDRSRPVVAVCRSGTRSAQAAVLLEQAGFGQAANLAGGMLRWHRAQLPVETGPV